jgi:hypothetical protein
VDCDAKAKGVQSDCAFKAGRTSRIQVHVTKAPAGGYHALQTKVRWDDAALDYRPTAEPATEALWQECAIPARLDNREPLEGPPEPWSRPVEPSVLFACVPFPFPESALTDTGAMLQFAFRCKQPGRTTLVLVPREGDLQLGSHFWLYGAPEIDPMLTNAAITCR